MSLWWSMPKARESPTSFIFLDGAGVLRDNNGSRFRFNVTENHYANKERYENIAKVN